jgi:hypothetical protein
LGLGFSVVSPLCKVRVRIGARVRVMVSPLWQRLGSSQGGLGRVPRVRVRMRVRTWQVPRVRVRMRVRIWQGTRVRVRVGVRYFVSE